jgi:dTMP kinase
MGARGKFIVLEGIDGSGKRTQREMLAAELSSRGIAFVEMSFPRYEGFFGKMVGQFLNGELGALEAVDPHFSALLYAGDRLEAKSIIEGHLSAGRSVLVDRYIGSNLAHQGAIAPAEGRAEFLKWLKQLEYEVYALPVEDLVIYLRTPASEAQKLVGKKEARGYTKLRRDILEANLTHLKTASEVYDQLAKQANWVTIECYDAKKKAMRAPEAIHKEIVKAVEGCVAAALRAKR